MSGVETRNELKKAHKHANELLKFFEHADENAEFIEAEYFNLSYARLREELPPLLHEMQFVTSKAVENVELKKGQPGGGKQGHLIDLISRIASHFRRTGLEPKTSEGKTFEFIANLILQATPRYNHSPKSLHRLILQALKR